MISRLRHIVTNSYQNKSSIELKRAIALFYYLSSGFIILPAICLIMAFVEPDEMVFGISNSVIILVFICFSLRFLKQGKYNLAANLFTTVILISVLSTLYLRSFYNPMTVYFSTFELLLIVIVQASLFCSRRWVIFYSLITIILNVVLYFTIKEQIAPEYKNALLTGAVYAALSVVLVTIISQLSITVFKSANDSLERELKKNKEYLHTIENLHNTSEKLQHKFDYVKDVSLKDELTSLRNRRYISEVIEDEIGSFINQKLNTFSVGKHLRNTELGLYGIYLTDLDHFKRVNDTYGHDAGDQVLKQLSQLFLDITRKDDVVIRWGGEEFLIILKNTKSVYLKKFADKLGQKVGSLNFKINSSQSINLTCSIGFAQLPFNDKWPDQLSLTDVITLADQALYHSKKNGRNRWTEISAGQKEISPSDIPSISSSLLKAEEKRLIQVTARKI